MGKGIKFEFDTANLDHIALHGVSRREVIQAFRHKNHIVSASEIDGEIRWKLFDKTAEGRYLTVVFILRKGKIRPVTAYTMNRKERDFYAPKIDS